MIKRLKDDINKEKLKQYQYAELIGVTPATLSRWLNGVDSIPKWVVKMLERKANHNRKNKVGGEDGNHKVKAR